MGSYLELVQRVSSDMGIIMPDESLQAAAKEAIKRLELRKGETANEWASRLAPTFFADLYERQEPFGPEFEAAIYGDLESLYER